MQQIVSLVAEQEAEDRREILRAQQSTNDTAGASKRSRKKASSGYVSINAAGVSNPPASCFPHGWEAVR